MTQSTDDERKEKHRKESQKYRRRKREELMEVYGNTCACCGESEELFLTIDHINRDGNVEREEYPHYSYPRIIKEADRSKYQILCFNCNMGRERNNGICPHKQ